jgi:hypothetical protein
MGFLWLLNTVVVVADLNAKLPDIGSAFDEDDYHKYYDDPSHLDPYGDYGHGMFGDYGDDGVDTDVFSRDWIEHVMNFELKDSEFFYEDVTEIGTVLRGGFFASDEKKSDVMFQILNPSMLEVYNSQGKSDVFFTVKAEEVGTYTFHFAGKRTQQVSFIVGAGKKGALKKEQVKTIEDQIKTVDRELRDIQHEGSYLWTRQKSHLKTVDAINSRIFWFTVVEFLALAAVAGFQVFYVKNLLSHRRLY